MCTPKRLNKITILNDVYGRRNTVHGGRSIAIIRFLHEK